MSDEQRAALRDLLKGGQAEREIPFARPDSLTKVIAVASGKGGVGKSSVTVNLAMALAAQGRKVGVLDADIYGHSIPAMLGVADSRPTSVEDMIMPVPAGRAEGDLDRHAEAAARPGRRLARADPGPGADPDAGRRLLGRPGLPAARSAARHRRRGDLAGPEAAERRGARGDHPAGRCRRGGRARRHDGLDDEPAGDRRGREHGLPRRSPARTAARSTGYEVFGSGGGEDVAATLSARLGYPVPLLAQIPLDPPLRAGGDDGVPLVDRPTRTAGRPRPQRRWRTPWPSAAVGCSAGSSAVTPASR